MKSASQGKAASKNTVPVTPSTGQANRKPRDAYQVLVSWSGTPLPPSLKISQRVIPTASSPCANRSGTSNMPRSSVCTPTLKAEPAEKDRFYSDLRSLIQSTPADDKVVILGDFNARVGQDSEAWKGVLGKHGVGNCNENGRLLLEFCAEKQFTITNTIFQHKNSLKTTWMHPRSKNWHLIDYVLVRQRDIQDVCHTRVMPSAECYTDHRLVRCKLRLLFKPKPRKGGPPKKKFKVGSSSQLKGQLTSRQAYS